MALIGFVPIVILWGCGGGIVPRGGNILIKFQFPPQVERLIPLAATEIVVIVSGEGLAQPMHGKATRAVPKVSFKDVPPKAKLVLAFSKTSWEALLPATTGAVTTVVEAGKTTKVTVELQAANPPSRLIVEPVTAPTGFFALQDTDRNEALFVNNEGGIRWGGVQVPDFYAPVIFTPSVLLPNGAIVGQSVRESVSLAYGELSGSGTATLKLVGVTGVEVPAGKFGNCLVIQAELDGTIGERPIQLTRTLYLAHNFGPTLLVSDVALGFSGQPLGAVFPSVLVSGQVSGITPSPFSMTSPVNLLLAPAYEGGLSAYLPLTLGNLYRFSQLLSPDTPPMHPF